MIYNYPNLMPADQTIGCKNCCIYWCGDEEDESENIHQYVFERYLIDLNIIDLGGES